MKVTLSLYPNTLGLGYVCIHLPDRLLDFGILNVKPASNEKVMAHIKRFTTYFRPDIVIVRDNAPVGKRGNRIDKLSQEIEDYAKSVGLPVHRYTRENVKDVFEILGATTKYEMTQELTKRFPDLAGRIPTTRKPWLPENYHMGIFDALALAITHQYHTDPYYP